MFFFFFFKIFQMKCTAVATDGVSFPIQLGGSTVFKKKLVQETLPKTGSELTADRK